MIGSVPANRGLEVKRHWAFFSLRTEKYNTTGLPDGPVLPSPVVPQTKGSRSLRSGSKIKSNNDAKERKYNSLRATMETVPTCASLVNCYRRVSCTFKSGVFLTHPRGMRAK